MLIIECDADPCGAPSRVLTDQDDQVDADVTLPRIFRDPKSQSFNFHTKCWQLKGAFVPLAGTTVSIRRRVPPAELPPAAEQLKAP